MRANIMLADRKRIGAALLLPVLLAIGCGVARHPALERARAAYQEARRDPHVVRHAAVPLDKAAQVVERADRLWTADEDAAEVEHLSYIAEKRIEIARVAAKRRSAENEIQELSLQREKILLESRTHDLSQAELEAMRARELAQDRRREAAEARQAAIEAEREARSTNLTLSREAEQARRQAETARKEAEEISVWAKELEQGLTDIQARANQTRRGVVLTLGDVVFAPGKSELNPQAMAKLKPLLTFLKEHPSHRLIVEGHTDNVGAASENLELSARRADSVRRFLIDRGVEPGRVLARGYGAAYPIASNGTAAGRRQNRRVEIVISKEGRDAAERTSR